MVTLELVEAELEHLNADDLAKVYLYIKQVEHDDPDNSPETDVLFAQDRDYPGDAEAWMRLWLGR